MDSTDYKAIRARRARERRRERRAAMLAGEVNPPHGKIATYTNYMCRCEDCKAAFREANHHDPVEGLKKANEYNRRIPVEKATNHKQRWSESEINIATDTWTDEHGNVRYTLSILEAAEYLGRTVPSIFRIRHRFSQKDKRPVANIRKDLA